jgi:hypothetical protein
MYFEQIFGAGFKSGIRRLRQIHLGYAVLCSVILILNVFPVSYLEIFSIFYFIIFFFTMLFLLGTSVVSAIRGRTEARIITAGFAIFWGLGIYDILGRGLRQGPVLDSVLVGSNLSVGHVDFYFVARICIGTPFPAICR